MTNRWITATALAGVLFVSACGSADESGEPVADDRPPVATEAAGDPPGTTAASATTMAAAVDDAPVDDSVDESSEVDPFDPTVKPEVVLPAEIPTELIITDIVEGSGDAAEVGDTVTVHYVGVRSEDGVEFDNSYDRGSPFTVTLGTGSVIQGWDQGLIGVKAGGRRQLDIPSALAYGDADRGTIRPGDALSFVVDVLAVEKPPVITAPPMADAADCPATDGSAPQQREFAAIQPFCIDITKTYTADIVTNFGEMSLLLLPEKAPQTVNNFVMLAWQHYFDDTVCHRAIPGFVVQCGDPLATGTGGPGYSIPDELPAPGEYQIGSIAMANAGPNSGGSQFFIVTGPSGASLPPQYALFGEVVGGLDTTVVDLDAVANPANNGVPPLEEIRIESITITES